MAGSDFNIPKNAHIIICLIRDYVYLFVFINDIRFCKVFAVIAELKILFSRPSCISYKVDDSYSFIICKILLFPMLES